MQQFAPPVPSTDGTTGIQGEQLDFTAVQFVEAQMREWISLKSTLVALLQWSVRFRLGVGALWLSSIVAGMWAAVLAQSIFLNIVNIKCATLIRSAQIIQPNFRTVIRPSGLTQVLGPLSNIGICMYMAWISTKSSTAQVRRLRIDLLSAETGESAPFVLSLITVWFLWHRGDARSVPLCKESVGEHY